MEFELGIKGGGVVLCAPFIEALRWAKDVRARNGERVRIFHAGQNEMIDEILGVGFRDMFAFEALYKTDWSAERRLLKRIEKHRRSGYRGLIIAPPSVPSGWMSTIRSAAVAASVAEQCPVIVTP